MKKYLIIIFLLSMSSVKAEHFLNFNIYEVDLSEYPTVKIIGGVTIEDGFYDDFFVTGRSLDVYENDNKIYFDIDIIPVEDVKIFKLTYESNLTKTCVRRYLFKYDCNGIHNGYKGQIIIYNKGNIKHMDNDYEVETPYSLEDEGLLEAVKNYVNNHSNKGKYPEASSVKLTSRELQNYSKKELKIMRNEIFARHGHIFIAGSAMDKYFSAKNWYKRRKKVNFNELTEIEKHNIEIIKELE